MNHRNWSILAHSSKSLSMENLLAKNGKLDVQEIFVAFNEDNNKISFERKWSFRRRELGAWRVDVSCTHLRNPRNFSSFASLSNQLWRKTCHARAMWWSLLCQSLFFTRSQGLLIGSQVRLNSSDVRNDSRLMGIQRLLALLTLFWLYHKCQSYTCLQLFTFLHSSAV